MVQIPIHFTLCIKGIVQGTGPTAGPRVDRVVAKTSFANFEYLYNLHTTRVHSVRNCAGATNYN